LSWTVECCGLKDQRQLVLRQESKNVLKPSDM